MSATIHPSPPTAPPLGEGGGDATASGFAVGGQVHFLQPGKSIGLANNGEALSVVANGAFAFKTRADKGATYAVTVATQPAGQSCWVEKGTGSVAAEVTSIVVRCTVTAQSTSGVGVAVDLPGNPPAIFQDLTIVAPIAFTSDVATKALITLFVPLVGPASPVSFVTAQFRAILDDKVVGDTIFKTSQFGKGGPCSLVTVIDIPPGSHTLRVKWATGGNPAGTTRLDRSTPTLLTLTLLDSLSIHQSTVVTEKVLTTGPSRGLTPGRYGVPDVSIGVPATGPLLVTSTIGAPYGNAIDVRTDLDVAGTLVDGGLPDAAVQPWLKGASTTRSRAFRSSRCRPWPRGSTSSLRSGAARTRPYRSRSAKVACARR